MTFTKTIEYLGGEDEFFSKIDAVIAEDGRERDGWKRTVSYHPGDGCMDTPHYTVTAASETILNETVAAIDLALNAESENTMEVKA